MFFLNVGEVFFFGCSFMLRQSEMFLIQGPQVIDGVHRGRMDSLRFAGDLKATWLSI